VRVSPFSRTGLGLAVLAVVLAHPAPAATWHVATNGQDAAAGSAQAPFATIARAIEAAAQAGDASEILIHAGVYRGNLTIPAPVPPTNNPPAWIVRPATNAAGVCEEVVIDGGVTITDALLLDAARGVYFLPAYLANFEPSMWEADTRLRYPFLADRLAVETFPGSMAPGREFADGAIREGVYFRTSDGRPPSEHDLGMARDRKGISILRPNVTIQGLRFRNFQLYFGVSGISIEAANVTVDSCEAWNCWGGFMVGEGIPDAKILACTARDVATGVKTYGRNTIVEDCRFFRVPGAFEVQEYEQDQCGIQFYASATQTARRNLCVGFQAGIFIKASSGVLILENNTVVAPPMRIDRGIGPNTWTTGSLCRGNVVVGYGEAVSLGEGLTNQLDISSNLLWHASKPELLEAAVTAIQVANGGVNVVADPQFVNQTNGDYRLGPSSPGATMGPQGTAIGALGAAPPGTVVVPLPPPPDPPAPPTGTVHIVGQPVVRTNNWGAVVLFRTDRPCTALLEWGAETNHLDQSVGDADQHRDELPVAGTNAPKTWPLTDHCLAVIGSGETGREYAFRIRLDNGATNAYEGRFRLQGGTQTLHVATTGVDAEDRGQADRPYASIQYAVDRALPGDRVVVGSGLYTGSVWMTHGGVTNHPITLESAIPWDAASGGAVLDGKREWEHAIRLGRVSPLTETWANGPLGTAAVAHVRITGFEMRWYNGLCVQADEAEDIVVDHCKFWSRHYVKGRIGICEGIGAVHCERLTIDHNLFFTLNCAVRFTLGIGLSLVNNTAAKCFHRVIGIVNAEAVYLRNNSFAFGSSYLLQIHGVLLGDLDSDYNNYAIQLLESSAGYATTPEEERLKRDENDFYYGESKALSAWDERTPEKPDPYLWTLTPWRVATGQDQHSIFAHPRYIDPQNRDFRLLATSPNIGRGENGATIGALGMSEEELRKWRKGTLILLR
jgi:hypothetical protein